MAVTMQDVRAYLDPEEVDYVEASRLGPEALPFLLQLVQGGDVGLASKAAYLASMIDGEQSADVIQAAAASQEAPVRVAAASGLRNLPVVHAGRFLVMLKNDPDPGVRKVALRSVAELRSPQLAITVQQMAEQDPEPFVREAAAGALQRLRGQEGELH